MLISPNYSPRASLTTLSMVSNTQFHQKSYEDTGGMLTEKKNMKICLAIWIQSKSVCTTICIHSEESKLEENWKKVLSMYRPVLLSKILIFILKWPSYKKPDSHLNKKKNPHLPVKIPFAENFWSWFSSIQAKFSKPQKSFFDVLILPAFTWRASLIDSAII